MTHIEVLDESVGFPLELLQTPGHHSGVPVAVMDKTVEIKRWCLVGWDDEVSATIGLARNTELIVLERPDIVELSINFMRPAKGRGWVALEVKLKSQDAPISLLQSTSFQEDALEWLMERKGKIESLFCVAIFVNDYGSDY